MKAVYTTEIEKPFILTQENTAEGNPNAEVLFRNTPRGYILFMVRRQGQNEWQEYIDYHSTMKNLKKASSEMFWTIKDIVYHEGTETYKLLDKDAPELFEILL